MKHFDSCRCEQCRKKHPQEKPAGCGFLMQQIVSSGKQQLYCEPFCLTLGPLPRNLISPLHIADVWAAGEVRVCEESCDCRGPGRRLRAMIPLTVTVCDSRGQSHVTQSEISVLVPMRSAVLNAADAGAQYLANASVRMSRSGGCFEAEGDVRVFLDVCVQVFQVLLRPVYAPAACAPVCLDLPLYPQPCKPHCPW